MPAPVTVKSLAVPSAAPVSRSPLLLGQDWSRLLAASSREILERRYLLGYLRRQRWFGSDAPKATATIDDWVALADGGGQRFLALVTVRSTQDKEERYLVPLSLARGAEAEAILRDAPESVVASVGGARKGALHGLVDGTMAADFLALFVRQGSLQFHKGRAQASHEPAFEAAVAGGPESLVATVSSADQSNSSIRYGSRLMLKLLRRIRADISPEVEIGRFLNAIEFSRAPRFAGSLEYEAKDGTRSTLAVMHEQIPHQTDGWQHALDALDRYLERAAGWDPSDADLGSVPSLWTVTIPESARNTIGAYLETAAMLGRRTAELHRALAGPRAHEVLGTARLDSGRVRELGEAVTQDALALPGLLENLPADIPDPTVRLAEMVRTNAARLVVATEDAIAGLPLDLLLTRVHGDLHLGQVLIHEEDAFFVDFEGEPTRSTAERRRLQSPMKDVAGMVRSFSYAAGAAIAVRAERQGSAVDRLRVWARWWQTWSIASFLNAYRLAAAGEAFLPGSAAALEATLHVFLLEKALYETRYELAHRPAWVSIPLVGLLDILPREPPGSPPAPSGQEG
jgi:maltose alpha-D-glucosyltransferase/alpha-amylase